jgi:cation diffusion facilitator family transporter
VQEQERLNRILRTTLLGALVNLALGGGKLAAGIIGHSQALVADAMESFADLIGSLVVWRGLVIAAKPPDDEHPYGHGKAEALASAGVAALLMTAALMIVADSVHEILRPHPAPAAWTLWVLGAVVVTKEVLFRFVLREGHEAESLAVKSDAWHHRADAITSLAAAAGISAALWGGPRWAGADDVAAIVAACVVAYNGWRILQPALHQLMDASAAPEVVEHIRGAAAGVAGVDDVEKCLVRRTGWHLLVDMHIHVAHDMTVSRSHEIAHEVKRVVKARVRGVRDVLVHVEPSRSLRSGA